MKWKVNEMTTSLMKTHAYVFTSWGNGKLMKWKSKWYSNLIKPKVEKQQVNKMKSKWNDKLMKWQVDITINW